MFPQFVTSSSMRFATLLAVSIFSTVFTTPASALSNDELFNGIDSQNRACFKRQYSAEHLVKYPKQTVREIRVSLYERGESQNTAIVAIKQKKSDRDWLNFSFCEDDPEVGGQVTCGLEDDSGRFAVTSLVNGRMTLKFKEGSRASFFLMNENSDAEPTTTVIRAAKGGDDVFILERVEATQCQDLGPATEEQTVD